MAIGPHTAIPAPGFIPRESSPPDTLLMILTRSTEMASNGTGFAFGQIMGGQSSGAASRRPAPPPPAAQPSNPRPPRPPPPLGGQSQINRLPPPSAGQTPNAQATPNPTPQQGYSKFARETAACGTCEGAGSSEGAAACAGREVSK